MLLLSLHVVEEEDPGRGGGRHSWCCCWWWCSSGEDKSIRTYNFVSGNGVTMVSNHPAPGAGSVFVCSEPSKLFYFTGYTAPIYNSAYHPQPTAAAPPCLDCGSLAVVEWWVDGCGALDLVVWGNSRGDGRAVPPPPADGPGADELQGHQLQPAHRTRKVRASSRRRKGPFIHSFMRREGDGGGCCRS